MKRKNNSKGKFHMCRIVVNGEKVTTTGGVCCDHLINDLGNRYDIHKPEWIRELSEYNDYDKVDAFDNSYTRNVKGYSPIGNNTITYLFITKHGSRHIRSVDRVIIAQSLDNGIRRIFELFPAKHAFNLRNPEDAQKYHEELNKIEGFENIKDLHSFDNLFHVYSCWIYRVGNQHDNK